MSRFLLCILLLPIHILFKLLSHDDGIVHLPEDDPEMIKAKSEAKHSLNDFKQVLANPPGDTEYFAIKVGFPTETGEEYIWVSDLKLQEDNSIKGTIGNDPNDIADLHYGDPVVVDDNDIADWAYAKGNVFQGHFTSRVLIPHMNKRMQKQMKDIYG